MKFLIFVAFLTLASFAFANEDAQVHFNGYKVLRTFPNGEQFETLLQLEDHGYDFWSDTKSQADIMATPKQLPELVSFLEEHNIDYRVMIEDVEKLVAAERESMHHQPKQMSWTNYQTFDIINEWLDQLVSQNPTTVSISTIGRSHEGRLLRVLKIQHGSEHGKPAFWIDSAIHAREWVSPSTTTYIINELVNNSTYYQEILDAVDFYFLVIQNPDGYVYSHITNRMWRKSRQDHNSPIGCVGVDINRNFGYQFGGNGSSSDKCSETYRGPQAYSEPEAEATKNYIFESTHVNWRAFVTVHSYSQLWMTPWGYTNDLPIDYNDLMEVATESASALTAMYGTAYRVGSAANILYQSSGSSRDWAKGEGAFKYVYTLELRDTGAHGFILPPEQIIPTAEET